MTDFKLSDGFNMREWVKNYFAKAEERRNKVWEKPVRFLGYDEITYSHWLSSLNEDETDNCFSCDAISLLDAARQMAQQYFFLNLYEKEYRCWVAESDSLDGCQGHSDGYCFVLNRELEEILIGA
jgi:hypothetical protein